MTRSSTPSNGPEPPSIIREPIAVAKPELGAKRQCQACGAKFFDLNKDPIVCPKCGTVFQGAPRARASPRRKRTRTRKAVAPAGVELVSLDEVEAAKRRRRAGVDDIDVEDDAADGRRRFPRGGGRGRGRRQLADRRRHRPRRGGLTARGRHIPRRGALEAARVCGYTAARAKRRGFAPTGARANAENLGP